VGRLCRLRNARIAAGRLQAPRPRFCSAAAAGSRPTQITADARGDLWFAASPRRHVEPRAPHPRRAHTNVGTGRPVRPALTSALRAQSSSEANRLPAPRRLKRTANREVGVAVAGIGRFLSAGWPRPSLGDGQPVAPPRGAAAGASLGHLGPAVAIYGYGRVVHNEAAPSPRPGPGRLMCALGGQRPDDA